MKKQFIIFSLVTACLGVNGQSLTEKEVIEKALENYPAIRIASIEVKQRKSLEKTAFNPEQPQFSIETPADVGIGFEVEQEFDFPSVYARRKQWLKSQTALSAESLSVTQNEVIRAVRLAFLDAQAAQMQSRFYAGQDSLWREILTRSQRLFDAGEINKADLIYAEKQSGFASFSFMNATSDKLSALAILSQYINTSVEEVDQLRALPFDTTMMSGTFYFENYLDQSIRVAESEIELSKANRLPDILIGYLKDPDPETAYPYRFKAGLTIPLWQGQYTGEIEAARMNIEKAQAESDLRLREAKFDRLRWLNLAAQSRKNLLWFETTAIPQMNQLKDIYLRLYEAGETDYAATLRNIADAFTINNQYLETLRTYNQAMIELDYLTGSK